MDRNAPHPTRLHSPTLLLTACVSLLATYPLATEANAAQTQAEWTGDRRWVGPDWHAAPLQDWRVTPNGLAATPRGPETRYAHHASILLDNPLMGFDVEVTVTPAQCDGKPRIPAAGLVVGAKALPDNHLHAVVYPDSFLAAGITQSGDLVLDKKFADAGIPANQPVRLALTGMREGDEVQLSLRAYDSQGNTLGQLDTKVPPDSLGSVIGVFASCSRKRNLSDPDPDVWATFQGFAAKGDGLVAAPENRFGPVLWSQYSYNGEVLRIQAQFPPVEPDDSQYARLEFQSDDGSWREAASATIEPASSTALFEIDDWDGSQTLPYRVAYDWEGETHYWQGEVRREPAMDKPWRLGLFSCDNGYLFPLKELVEEVRSRDPDLLFFAGDQFYEGFGNFLFVRDPLEVARLDYLRKWYLFGWTNRHILKDRPSIIIPDDHDVFQGNIWGHGGRAIPGQEIPRQLNVNFALGGYAMEPDWVNLAERSQTGHLPPPYDPRPVDQGIGVYFTQFTFGGVSFAILEDRKFKIGAASQEAKMGDDTLLGERQIAFLNAWAEDWSRGARLKCVLSQTIFAQPVTHASPDLHPIRNSTDNNSWPVKGRNRAVETIRKSAAFSLHGDQHLPLQLRHGIDEWEDAGVAFMGPATCVGFPRAWWPNENPAPDSPKQEGELGRHHDGFNHKITVDAVANPTNPEAWPKANKDPVGIAMEKASGYAMVDFDPAKQTMTTHCFPLPYPIAPERVENGQYIGWPLTFSIDDNDGRTPIGHLPEQSFKIENPVVGVYMAESGELVYARRIQGNSFRAPVFAPGTYELRYGKNRPEHSAGNFTITPAHDQTP